MDRIELAVMRGAQAEQLKANPLFEQAFADTRKGVLEAWAQLDTSATDDAYDLHRMLKMLDRVRRCIEVHIDTGKLAQKEIEGRKQRLNPFRRA
jgi:hypothetical protein